MYLARRLARPGWRGGGRPEPPNPKVDLMGLPVDNLDPAEVVDHIIGSLQSGRGGWVATPNVDHLRQAVALPDLAQLLRSASLVVPDGMPLVWASRLQGTPLKARVAGSELVYPLARAASASGFSFFLLGAAPGVAERAAPTLRGVAPGLRIAGCHAPPFGFENHQPAVERIVEVIERARPDIVICAFGFPKQERLIAALAPQFPRAWFVAAGGTLAMLAGDKPAAPAWMRRRGLEWVHRLRLEPERLFRRYLIDDLPFALRLLATSGARRVGLGHDGPNASSTT